MEPEANVINPGQRALCGRSDDASASGTDVNVIVVARPM